MYHRVDRLETPNDLEGITFRKATNADVLEIHRQNAICFGDELGGEETNDSRKGMIMPEEEEKRGMTIYLSEAGQQVIGKVHIDYYEL